MKREYYLLLSMYELIILKMRFLVKNSAHIYYDLTGTITYGIFYMYTNVAISIKMHTNDSLFVLVNAI